MGKLGDKQLMAIKKEDGGQIDCCLNCKHFYPSKLYKSDMRGQCRESPVFVNKKNEEILMKCGRWSKGEVYHEVNASKPAETEKPRLNMDTSVLKPL